MNLPRIPECLPRLGPTAKCESSNKDEASAHRGDPPLKKTKIPSPKRELCDDDEASRYTYESPEAKRCRLSDSRERLLACPFAKYDITAPPFLSCRARGWQNIARVKEHLLRVHYPPPHCPQCHHTFKDKEELDRHQVREEPCKVEPKPTMFGRAWLSEKALCRVRSRKSRGQSEETAWEALYKLCFEDAKSIPSPYLNDDPPPHWFPMTASAMEHLSQSMTKSLLETLLSLRPEFSETQEELGPSIQGVVLRCIKDAASRTVIGNADDKIVQEMPLAHSSASSVSSDCSVSPDCSNFTMSISHWDDAQSGVDTYPQTNAVEATGMDFTSMYTPPNLCEKDSGNFFGPYSLDESHFRPLGIDMTAFELDLSIDGLVS